MVSDRPNAITLDDGLLTTLVRTVINGIMPSKVEPIACLGATYVALRQQGRLQQAYWEYQSDLELTLSTIVQRAIATQHCTQGITGIDAIELCFTHSYRWVEAAEFKTVFANVHRGIRGIEIQYKDRLVRYSPTRMIAANYSFLRVFELFLEHESLTEKEFFHHGGILQAFESRQVLVLLKPDVLVIPLHRGNRIVPLEKLSGAVLADMTTTMGQWLVRQVQSDGRMIYKYFPSRGQESTSNNLIRQFMATLCLIRYAQMTEEAEHWQRVTQNLHYNLKQFYRKDGELGIVEYDGKVKLGAIALLALAILEYTQSELGQVNTSDYADIFESLCRTIDHLWHPDGSFRTFYQPYDRNDNQNFYPGEALLFWAALYRQTHDSDLLDRCYKSFFYYQTWHQTHYNPAFVPWHTQAYALLYAETGDRQFLDAIFAMNDRLLSMQQWRTAQYGDLQGRFYDPNHPDYGPPHASSTGVYLEGLADAYSLAVKTGELHRSQSYRQAIWCGLRSIRQLQFRDEVDLFYISKRSPVQGGLRTTVYDNIIRVDNVQHGLMALIKLSHLLEFAEAIAPPIPHDAEMSQSSISIPSGGLDELRNFRRLKTQVEIAPLLREIQDQSELWLHNTSRQDKIQVQRETHTIYLRSAVKPFPPGITNGNDVHESRRTAIADQFPVILSWIEHFAADIGGELGRVTIVRLAPHGRVYRHIDQGEYYKERDRFHLVLHSPRGSLLGCADEWVRMQPGELWWFDNKKPHEALNESDDWRIHLIFDVLGGVF